MHNINSLSPNMLNTFVQCQQKFCYRYIKKLSLPQRNLHAEVGKKIHALASYYLKGENVEKMERTLSESEKQIWDSLKNSKYFKLDVLKTEYSLSCKVGKYWLGGRLDSVVQNGEEYFILDYKTGQIPKNPQNDFQTIVYLLCVDKLLGKKGGYSDLKFVYLGLKNNEESQIVLTSELKKHYEEEVVKVCDKINFAISSSVFEKNTQSCKYCEYNKICNRETL